MSQKGCPGQDNVSGAPCLYCYNTKMFAKCRFNPKKGTEIVIEMGMAFSKINGAADFELFSFAIKSPKDYY